MPLEVASSQVVCDGPPDAPHEPRRLQLPESEIARCPVCGLTYRRTAAAPRISRASWPKAE